MMRDDSDVMFGKMAVLTGIEPAISGVTDRCVNHYTTAPCEQTQLHHLNMRKYAWIRKYIGCGGRI